jgi:hypothetical protein
LAAAAVSAGQLVLGNDPTKNLSIPAGETETDLFFKISLAEWSLNKSLFAEELDNLDFPAYTKDKFDIHSVEYVNQFFPSADKEYAKKLLGRTEDIGVKNVLIMVDGEGHLGEQDEGKRIEAVENHYKWVECAQILGCHSIRVFPFNFQESPSGIWRYSLRSFPQVVHVTLLKPRPYGV